MCLLPPSETNVSPERDILLESQVIKQTTELWFSIRKTAKVSGSTMVQALGIKSLQYLCWDHKDSWNYKPESPKLYESDEPVLLGFISDTSNARGRETPSIFVKTIFASDRSDNSQETVKLRENPPGREYGTYLHERTLC